MGLGDFLIPTLVGYWFLNVSNYTRFSIHRQSGYHVLFKSALFGLGFFAVAMLFLSFVPCGPFLPAVLPSFANTDSLVLSIVLAGLSCIPNWWRDKAEAVRIDAEKNGNHMELLIANARENEKLIEVTLKNRKSYIGFPLEDLQSFITDPDLRLLPVASGYRDERTMKLNLTTDHADVFNAFDDVDQEDFQIVISMSEVISVRIFDLRVYEVFQYSAPPSRTNPISPK